MFMLAKVRKIQKIMFCFFAHKKMNAKKAKQPPPPTHTQRKINTEKKEKYTPINTYKLQ